MTKLSKLSAALILAAAAASPALAAPETYVVDGTHTFARFSYSHFGYSTQLSRFDKTTGTVVFDKAAKTGTVDRDRFQSRAAPDAEEGCDRRQCLDDGQAFRIQRRQVRTECR